MLVKQGYIKYYKYTHHFNLNTLHGTTLTLHQINTQHTQYNNSNTFTNLITLTNLFKLTHQRIQIPIRVFMYSNKVQLKLKSV